MAAPNDRRPYPPELLRRVISDIANEGISYSKISDLIAVLPATVSQWMNRGAVKKGLPMTEEQIEASITACLTAGRKTFAKITDKGYRDKGFRSLTTKQKEYVEKGFRLTDAAVPKNTPESAVAFAGVLACVERQLDFLETQAEKSETIQDVAAALTAGIGLKQLKEIYTDPPRIDNWKDVKIINDMVRDSLGMNRKEPEGLKSRAVDAKILGFHPKQVKQAKIAVTLDTESLEEYVL
tara:strand:+ start:1075 stop:1788 length:714 start_codon:yes stop_codon:yes gene_type:complete